MPKTLSTKKRTQVKDLPKKNRTLNSRDMKKVKGGVGITLEDALLSGQLKPPKPPTTK